MRPRTPWKILPLLLGATFLVIALAKLASPETVCPNRLSMANRLMFPVEALGGLMLLRREYGRRLGAFLLACLMLGAACFLTLARTLGVDTSGCGCFGPLEMDYQGQMGAILALFGACAAVFVAEEALRRGRAAWRQA